MTRASRLAAIEAGGNSSADIPEELESNSTWPIINKIKSTMIYVLPTVGLVSLGSDINICVIFGL